MWKLRRWAFGSAAGESGADESTGAALAAGALAAPGPDVAEARATARLVPAGGVVAEQWDDQPVAARTRNSPLKPLVPERAPGLVGGDEEDDTVVPVVRLSPEELVRKRSATFSLPCGAPEGPWATDTDALHEINHWSSDHTKPGGSWGVIFLKGKQPGNSARGAQRVLGCAEHKKSSCGWKGRIEETTAGWMWYSFSPHADVVGKLPALENGHSHALTVTLGQRLAHATQRDIPSELHDTAKLLRKSGASIKDVENFLRLKVQTEGDVAAFTYSDVRHLVGATTSERAWDATDFIQRLDERREGRGLFYEVLLSSEGRLESAFFVMDGAVELYAAGGEGNVIVFDTKHSTNTHRLKLGCIVTVSPSGATKVLAASLIASETKESFIWVFTCFMKAFRVEPAAIFTDSDPWMAVAIALVFLTALHFLCTWHLSKNLLTHVKPAMFDSLPSYDAFIGGWWELCLRSDTSCIDSFDSEWAALLAPLRATASSDALEWLDGLYQKRERWAARYTWRTLTLAMHSSQRSKSVHSAIDRFCSASMLLVDLLQRLDEYGANVDVRADTRDALRCMRLLRREGRQSVPPIISSAARIVSPWAVLQLEAQWYQSLHYVVRRLPDVAEGGARFIVSRIASAAASSALPSTVADQAADAGDGVGGTATFSAARTTTLAWCSCQYPSSAGVSCRHQLAVATQLQLHDASALIFAPHWRLIDDDARALLVRQLLETPVAPLPSLLGGPPPQLVMLKSDRFALLMSE